MDLRNRLQEALKPAAVSFADALGIVAFSGIALFARTAEQFENALGTDSDDGDDDLFIKY